LPIAKSATSFRTKRKSPVNLTSIQGKSIQKLLTFLRHDADLDISLITRAHVAAFRSELAQKLAPGTANIDLKAVKMLFRAAKRDGFIHDDPAEFVDTVKRDNGRGRRSLTIGEIQAVLSVADPEWQSLIASVSTPARGWQTLHG
jgi:site-specific recombinase XerD